MSTNPVDFSLSVGHWVQMVSSRTTVVPCGMTLLGQIPLADSLEQQTKKHMSPASLTGGSLDDGMQRA
jgi:hypothetical protein